MNREEPRVETAAELADRLRISRALAEVAVANQCTLPVAELALQLRSRRAAATAPAAVADAPAGDASSAPGDAKGLFAKPMPVATALMRDLKASLDPEIYTQAMQELGRGAGYVIDHTTGIALGGPPVDRFERGRVEQRHGFAIMRVRPKA